MAFKHGLNQPGLKPGADSEYWLCLGRTLIYPAGGYLAVAGNADLYTRSIREIDEVIDHAIGFAPLRLTAGARIVMPMNQMLKVPAA